MMHMKGNVKVIGSIEMKTKQPLHMWEYWKEDKGFERALTEYFPELLNDPQIHVAYLNWKGFKVVMENRIRELWLEQEDEE